MLMEHLSKINLSLGALVLICFFLPWFSVDCGNITVLKVSGYDLTTGKIAVDDDMLRQATSQYGQSDQDFSALGNERGARPQFYLLMVAMCALGIIGYSAKMMNEFNKVGTIAVIAFSVFGLLLVIFTVTRDFGMEIPSDAAMFVQISNQFGFYGTVLGFLAAAVLSVIGLRANAEPDDELETLSIPIPAIPPTAVDIEQLTLDEPLNVAATNDFTEFEKTEPQEPKKTVVPKGAKACPSCGVVVSVYQTKCMKCGAKLKPGK